MLRFLCFAELLFISAAVWSQEEMITQDPQAGQVLDRVALKAKSMESMQADFTLIIEDRKEKTKNSSTGSFLVKKNMYKISSEKSVVFFNGKTMWTYLADQNEVTITEPGTRTDDFMSNPAQFFTTYQHDFKYRYVRETTVNGSRCHEIDLFPRNLDQPYSRIKIFINVQSDLPEIISSIGKDGIDYIVYLKNTILGKDVDNAAFSFDPAKYRKVEIVDMRGI
jgi:outer membrane lipoprotein-sorting protein